jgi:hypothetical protein
MGSGEKQTTETQKTTAPWWPQQGYLTGAWDSAQQIYNNLDKRGPYQGNFVAAPNADQYDQNKRALEFVNGQGSDYLRQLIGAGGSLAKSGLQFTNDAAAGLKAFNSSDRIGNAINDANRVRSGFDVPGAVRAAMADAQYQASTDTLPSLYRGASATGNLNSDRTALSEGVVRGRLADSAANISANLNNSLFDRGLSASQQGSAQLLQSLSQLGSLGGSAANTGIGAINSGIGRATDLYDLGAKASGSTQKLDQSKIDNDLAKFNNVNDFYWNNLRNLYGIVGSQNWGAEEKGTEKITKTPSTLSTIGSILGGVGGLMKK